MYPRIPDRELDLAVLASPWLSADHAARIAAVAHDKPWQDRWHGWHCPNHHAA
jgi:hypothetical protein